MDDRDNMNNEADPQAEYVSVGHIKSTISCILDPVILAIICVIIYLTCPISVLGLALALAAAFVLGVVIYLNGFYFFILPLPILGIGFFGCDRIELSLGRKVVMAILCVALTALAFVFLFFL